MNIIELEEGLRNLIATQPSIMSGANASVVASIKNIIESHKAFAFELEKYPEQDILKVGLLNESSKLELNLTSYVCQILQERGINIMLYVPKYAAVYSQAINKYVDEVSVFEAKENVVEESEIEEKTEDKNEKYIVVEKQEQSEPVIVEEKAEPKPPEMLKRDYQMTSKTEGRDYLMNLLKK